MASQRLFSRGPLTDTFIAYLNSGLAATSTLLEIGDGIAPPDAGWQGGQPSLTGFKPYAVVNAGSATPNFQDNVLGRITSWKIPYSLLCVGGSRQQVDWASDQLKPLADSFSAQPAGTGPRIITLDAPWKITLSNYTQMGAPSRNDQVDPPIWQATDSIILWLEHATI